MWAFFQKSTKCFKQSMIRVVLLCYAEFIKVFFTTKTKKKQTGNRLLKKVNIYYEEKVCQF